MKLVKVIPETSPDDIDLSPDDLDASSDDFDAAILQPLRVQAMGSIMVEISSCH